MIIYLRACVRTQHVLRWGQLVDPDLRCKFNGLYQGILPQLNIYKVCSKWGLTKDLIETHSVKINVRPFLSKNLVVDDQHSFYDKLSLMMTHF